MWNDKDYQFFDKHNKARPSSQSHGVTSDEITEKMKQLKPNKWRMEGNQLIGETDMGTLVQTISTDYILKGTDDQGLPIFAKVEIQ